MNQQEWFEHFMQAPPIVLRVRLLPYTLGHDFLLRWCRSPLLEPGRIGSTAELASALAMGVLICSQNFKSGRRMLGKRFPKLLLRFWNWRLGKGVDWHSEWMRFEEYRQVGRWSPEINHPVGGRTLVSPGLFRLLALMMRDFGFSEEEALDLEFARAQIYYATQGDLTGGVSLFGPGEEALLAMVEKMDREGASALAQSEERSVQA